MDHLNSFLGLWKRSGIGFPELGITYSHEEKKRRENHHRQLVDRFKARAVQGKNNQESLSDNDLFAILKEFFRHSLEYTDPQLDIVFSEQMIGSTCSFINAARQFDPSLPMESVFQACRNVWIMNGVQYLLEKEIRLTPSVFAYSMLYPYTDNLIDDPEVSAEEKKEFSERFALRLKNLPVRPHNATEAKIFRLVGLIENEWDRKSWPGVYSSLLSIHSAQTGSMELLTCGSALSATRALEICAEKGGASVIADGYLVSGDLCDRQEEFLYIYGAYLQLLDDLQDLQEDAGNGLLTCFSMAAMRGNIDQYISKLYRLGSLVVDKMGNLKFRNSGDFLGLIEKSYHLFILGSIMSGSGFISREYLKRSEKYFPFTREYTIQQNQSIANYPKDLFARIAELTPEKYDRPEWL